jgi:hypothetical protein
MVSVAEYLHTGQVIVDRNSMTTSNTMDTSSRIILPGAAIDATRFTQPTRFLPVRRISQWCGLMIALEQ